MESHYRIAPRNRFRVAILALYLTAIFLFIFPAEAFYLSVREQVIPVTSSLFSQEGNQDVQDSQTEKDEQTSEPSLRRYQGGMIRPVVIAAKPEPTSNFMKVNGQDTSLSRRDGTESSRMFRPTVERTNDNENVNSPQPLSVDESTITTTYITGGMIGAQTGIGNIAEREAENKAKTEIEAAPNKSLEETKVEAVVEMDPLVEVEPSEDMGAEAAEVETTVEEFNKSRDIEQNLESSEEKITEEEIEGKETEEASEEEREMEKQLQEDQTSKPNDSTNSHKAIENIAAETIEPIFDESKRNKNFETEEVKSTNFDVSALEEEDEKLEAIQAKIDLRKQQQAELEKIEADLLRKTEEIMRRKEELLRLEEEFALARKASKNEGNASGNIPEKEKEEEEVPYYSPKEYSALSPEEKAKLREARSANRKTDNSPSDYDNSKDMNHPILGPAIVDLGYKRVHVVSSGRLGTIPLWKKQRTYRYDRVQRMAAEKGKHMHLGFPGIICLYEDKEGKLSIIDGQHRVGMMQALRERRKKFKQGEVGEQPDEIWNEQEKYFQNVLVEVHSEVSYATQAINNDIDYAKQVFQEINKAQPIALIDEEDFASEPERKIISEAVSILKDLYGDMFISSRRCRIPNVNVDNLRNSILGSRVLKRHKELTTGKELTDWLITQNSVVGELYETDSEMQRLIEPNAWVKASNNGFYLGLESSWLYK